MASIISLGELLVDFVSQSADAPLQDAASFVKSAGGAPANVAVGVQRLGTPSAFVSCVGDDPFGVFLRDTLAREGVDVSGIKTHATARTTLAFVAPRGNGGNDFCFYRNPGADAQLRPEDVPAALFQDAKIFHCGSLTLSQSPAREAQLQAAQAARAAGLLVSYDPNWRPSLWDDHDVARGVIARMMTLADVVKIAEDEWEFVTGTHDFLAGARRLCGAGPQLVFQTRGANGAAFFCDGTIGEVPGFDVQTADTLGAGDAFMAGVLHLLSALPPLDEPGLRTILRFGNACGALSTQQAGAIPSLPTHAQVEAFLAEHA